MRFFNIDIDGIDGFDHWEDYVVDDDEITEKEMMEDVRAMLKELNGGHADIWETDDDGNEMLFAEIEM